MSTPLLMISIMLLPVWIPLIGATLGFISDRMKQRVS
jgi:hypothetical protein